MPDETVNWSVVGGNSVSVDPVSGIVTVDSTERATSFVLQAASTTNPSVVRTKTVELKIYITGKVYNLLTGSVISDAKVQLGTQQVTTGPDGRYVIEGLKVGDTYNVTINLTSLSGGENYSVQVGHDRSFSVNSVIPDTYKLIVAYPGYLMAGKHVEVTAGQVHDAGLITLLAGDLDGNNVVDIFDLDMLTNAYGAVRGDGGFNTVMDFNGDRVIDIFT